MVALSIMRVDGTTTQDRVETGTWMKRRGRSRGTGGRRGEEIDNEEEEEEAAKKE